MNNPFNLKNLKSVLKVLFSGRGSSFFTSMFMLVVVGLLTGSSILSVLALFIILGVITRYPSARSPYDFSLVNFLTMMLAIGFGFKIAALYGFFIWWIARKWNPMEDFTYTITGSVSVLAAALMSPFLISWASGNLVLFAVYFIIARFAVYSLVITPLTRPGTIVTDFIFNATEFGLTLLMTVLLMYAVGLPTVEWLGVSGWETGSLSIIFEVFK